MATRAHTVSRFYLKGFVDPESEGKAKVEPWVWIGDLHTGNINRQSPKNISVVRGMYDGPGGLADRNATIEDLMSKIESAAARAIRVLPTTKCTPGLEISPAIWRFLAWQAARTPGYLQLEAAWLQDWVPEPGDISGKDDHDNDRPLHLKHRATGATREVKDLAEFETALRGDWHWDLTHADKLEMIHLQAWYFQAKHFPAFIWRRLDAPDGDRFITSDRGLTWLADGYVATPPSALGHLSSQIVAPLTSRIALVGTHRPGPIGVRARELNRFVACTASTWIAGPTRNAVKQALLDARNARTMSEVAPHS